MEGAEGEWERRVYSSGEIWLLEVGAVYLVVLQMLFVAASGCVRLRAAAKISQDLLAGLECSVPVRRTAGRRHQSPSPLTVYLRFRPPPSSASLLRQRACRPTRPCSPARPGPCGLVPARVITTGRTWVLSESSVSAVVTRAG